jgi:hypothetical protein
MKGVCAPPIVVVIPMRLKAYSRIVSCTFFFFFFLKSGPKEIYNDVSMLLRKYRLNQILRSYANASRAMKPAPAARAPLTWFSAAAAPVNATGAAEEAILAGSELKTVVTAVVVGGSKVAVERTVTGTMETVVPRVVSVLSLGTVVTA